MYMYNIQAVSISMCALILDLVSLWHFFVCECVHVSTVNNAECHNNNYCAGFLRDLSVGDGAWDGGPYVHVHYTCLLEYSLVPGPLDGLYVRNPKKTSISSDSLSLSQTYIYIHTCT